MIDDAKQEERRFIRELYESGLSYCEIREKHGYCMAKIASVVKGMRTAVEANRLYRERGRGKLTEKGREKLSEMGRRAAKRSKKFWTKPERQFIEILRELGIGVRLPDYVVETCDARSDPDGNIFYQFPIQRYACDFVDVNKRIVYRVNGDFWHSNPILYDEQSLTDIQRHNRRQDKNCKRFLEGRGWHVCDIWESDIYWRKELVKKKIGSMSQMDSESALHAESSEFEPQYSHQDWSERLKKLWFKQPRKPKKEKSSRTKKEKSNRAKKEGELIICINCGKEFKKARGKLNYCSEICAKFKRRKTERPTKEKLEKEIKSNSWLSLSRKYRVSDNAIRNWARGYGITWERKCVDHEHIRLVKPMKEELKVEIRDNTWIDLGRKYAVHATTVRGWAKRYGIL